KIFLMDSMLRYRTLTYTARIKKRELRFGHTPCGPPSLAPEMVCRGSDGPASERSRLRVGPDTLTFLHRDLEEGGRNLGPPHAAVLGLEQRGELLLQFAGPAIPGGRLESVHGRAVVAA